MAERRDLRSILPFLPLILRSSSLSWPSRALRSLETLALGPGVTRVDSGDALFRFILDLRASLGLSSHLLAPGVDHGFALFFDEMMPRGDSEVWFRDVVPELGKVLIRLPALLEEHYVRSDEFFGEKGKFGLRIMRQQEPGMVILSQELIAALLACALFCLFPTVDRGASNLPDINFDGLFAPLHYSANQNQEQKLKCLVHYFKRIGLRMGTSSLSFERKVLTLEENIQGVMYPAVSDWENSSTPLCSFTEEIRFMISPELIAGMLFMVSMNNKEAIEIVGAERFSCYMGYGSSFRFTGDYVDNKPVDSMGRKKTRVLAIDALCDPGRNQYEIECLLREANKAFCGFSNLSKHSFNPKTLEGSSLRDSDSHYETKVYKSYPKEGDNHDVSECDDVIEQGIGNNSTKNYAMVDSSESIGIATGNWGCGAFGGDPELKSIIQWLAASQASRSFIHYYTFQNPALERLEEVTRWIIMQKGTVGETWHVLAEYCTGRLNRETYHGFFDWLLPGCTEHRVLA